MEVEPNVRYSVLIKKTVPWGKEYFLAGTRPILKGHVITDIREANEGVNADAIEVVMQAP